MAFYAVYEIETGVIQNIVECPTFLADQIHYVEGQEVLELEQQISQINYLIVNNGLVEKS